MKIITNYTFKGGVGKTVTAISHAEGLAKKGFKVLLIDIDPQTNLTTYFIGDEEGMTLVDCIFDSTKARDCITKTHTENIDMIPGSMRLIITNDELTVSKGFKQLKLLNILKQFDDEYDYCIIDCPPYYTELVVNALYATDLVIIPFRGDRNSLYAYNTVVDTINEFNEEFARNIKYKGLFTGKQNNNNDRDVYDQLSSEGSIYQSSIRFQGAPVSKLLSDKQSLYDMKKNIGNDYQQFVEEFLGGVA